MRPYVRCVVWFVLFFASARVALGSDLAGQVRDVCGANIPGATVTLRNASGDDVQAAATTGRYVFRNVSPGLWTLTAQMVGFQTTRQDIQIGLENDNERDVRLPYDVSKMMTGQLTLSHGDATLYKRHVVYGTVTDVNGRPIAGAKATLQGTTALVISPQSEGCTTDELGRYFLWAWGQPQRWTFSVTAVGYAAYSLIDYELVPEEPRIVDVRLRTP